MLQHVFWDHQPSLFAIGLCSASAVLVIRVGKIGQGFLTLVACVVLSPTVCLCRTVDCACFDVQVLTCSKKISGQEKRAGVILSLPVRLAKQTPLQVLTNFCCKTVDWGNKWCHGNGCLGYGCVDNTTACLDLGSCVCARKFNVGTLSATLSCSLSRGLSNCHYGEERVLC